MSSELYRHRRRQPGQRRRVLRAGRVGNWLAISAIRGGDLVGYIRPTPAMPEARYKATLRKDLQRRATYAKTGLR